MNTLTLIFVLAITLALSKPYFVQGEYHVYIINDLGPNEPLDVHCKSADDDLAKQTILWGQEVNWSFNLNIAATTLFWCHMDWNAYHDDFEIFNGREEEFKCGNGFDGHCYRKARIDGIYYSKHRDGDYEKKYSWT